MTSKTVLDLIALPPGVPGNLECRFQKATYADDGTWINDGSRPLDRTKYQRERHRVAISPGQSIRGMVDRHVSGPLAKLGYEPPSTHLIRHIARHVWPTVEARRERLNVDRPRLRLMVRAFGFDIENRGELAIAIAKVTVRPGGDVVRTHESSVLLQPGDPIDMVREVAGMVAEQTHYEPLCDEDQELIRHVAAACWTPERLERRAAAWALADAHNDDRAMQARQIEFAKRMDNMSVFFDAPKERAVN